MAASETLINVALVVLSTSATIAAIGGDTWIKGKAPLTKRITPRGWLSIVFAAMTFALGTAKEIISDNAQAAAEAKRDAADGRANEARNEQKEEAKQAAKQILDLRLKSDDLLREAVASQQKLESLVQRIESSPDLETLRKELGKLGKQMTPPPSPPARAVAPPHQVDYVARQQLHALAQEFNRLRLTEVVSNDRTRSMTKVVSDAEDLAVRANLSDEELEAQLASPLPSGTRSPDLTGERLVGIALVTATGRRKFVPQLLDIMDRPGSAFEQYTVLNALRRLAAGASQEQRILIGTRVREARTARRIDGPATDQSRIIMADAVLKALQAPV